MAAELRIVLPLLVVVLFRLPGLAETKADTPNIVLIFADDVRI